MNENAIYNKPVIDDVDFEDKIPVSQHQQDESYKVKNIKPTNIFGKPVTYTYLQNKASQSKLIIGRTYYMESGGPNGVKMLVRATARNKIGAIAEGVMNNDEAYPVIYNYDFESNAITMLWRPSINRIEGYDQLTMRMVVGGDSMSNDSGGDFPYWLGYNQNLAHAPIINYAIAGQTAAQVDATYEDTIHRSAPVIGSTQDYWLTTYCGLNDITAGATANDIYNYLVSIWAKARADGYKIMAFTIMYSSDLTGPMDTVRLGLNTLILSNKELYDIVVTPERVLDPRYTPQYFADDEIHLNIPGSQYFANLINYCLSKKRIYTLYPTTGFTGDIPDSWDLEFNVRRIGLGTSSPDGDIDIRRSAPIVIMNNVSAGGTEFFGHEYRRGSALDGYSKVKSSLGRFEFGSGRDNSFGGYFAFMTDLEEAISFSKKRGFVPPVVDTAYRDSTMAPQLGAIIFNTTINKHQGWDGSTWNNLY